MTTPTIYPTDSVRGHIANALSILPEARRNIERAIAEIAALVGDTTAAEDAFGYLNDLEGRLRTALAQIDADAADIRDLLS